MATAKDIAEKLGVSLSAVSIALNGKPGISDETRKRILETAQELGYRKRPWNERSPSIIQLFVYVENERPDMFSASPFFSRVVEGISKRAAEVNYSIQISYIQEPDLEKGIASMIPANCAGVLLLASALPDRLVHYFGNIDLPFVVLDNDYRFAKLNCVSIDNYYSIHSVVDYLHSLGHTNLCFVGQSAHLPNTLVRAKAFSSIISDDPSMAPSLQNPLITVDRISGPDAVIQLKKDLESLAPMPTAFVCSNDFVASSTISTLKLLGYRIPEDVSVTGFDNIPLAEIVSPTITTVNIPKARIGIMGIDRLVELIGGNTATAKSYVLSDLTVRQSTGPVKK